MLEGLFGLALFVMNLNDGSFMVKQLDVYKNYKECEKEVRVLQDSGAFPRVDPSGQFFGTVFCVKVPGQKS